MKTAPPQKIALTGIDTIQLCKTLLAFLGLLLLAGQLSAQKAHRFPIPKPTEAHKVLADEAGTWDTVVKMYFQGPKAPPVEYKGAETVELASGGLHSRRTSRCQMGDQEFEAHTLMGYNPRSKEYTGTTINNFTMVPIHMKGTYDPEKKALTMFSAVVDGSGKEIKQKEVTQIVDDKTRTFTTFMLVDAGGKEREIKLMEVTATRR